MRKTKPPCYQCEDREPACWGKCERYAAYFGPIREEKKKVATYAPSIDYTMDQRIKAQREAKRNRRI